jgi:hypothetical protein
MLQNEVFGGLSPEERNVDQIHELLSDSQASEVGKSSSGSAQAEPESVKKVKEKRKARGSVA